MHVMDMSALSPGRGLPCMVISPRMLIFEVVVLYLVPPCIPTLLPSPTTQALLWEPGCGTHSILDGQVSTAPVRVFVCLCMLCRVCARVCVHACTFVLDSTDAGSLMSVYPQLCVCQQFGDNKVNI